MSIFMKLKIKLLQLTIFSDNGARTHELRVGRLIHYPLDNCNVVISKSNFYTGSTLIEKFLAQMKYLFCREKILTVFFL